MSRYMNGTPVPLCEIVIARNPAVFNLPEIISLFERAFPNELPTDAETAITHFRELADHPKVGLILGREVAAWRGLSICMLPSVPLFQPTVYQFYNEGTATLRNALVDASVEWFKAKGYARFIALNHHADHEAAWQRLFRRAGKVGHYGTAYLFDLEEEQCQESATLSSETTPR